MRRCNEKAMLKLWLGAALPLTAIALCGSGPIVDASMTQQACCATSMYQRENPVLGRIDPVRMDTCGTEHQRAMH